MSDPQAAERHRLECEARTWIRQGYDTRDKVNELIQRIARRRGIAAAERLRDEMRRQWALQQGPGRGLIA